MRHITLFLVLMLWAVSLTAHAQTLPMPERQDILSTSPDRAVILAKSDTRQVFLYHVGSQTRVDFSGDVVNYLASIERVVKKDDPRSMWVSWHGNEIFFTVEGLGHGVTRFNRDTGQQIGFYPSGVEEISAEFRLSPDGRQLSVYDEKSKRGIWYHLDSDEKYAYQSSSSTHSFFIYSPDGRFLVLHQAKYRGINRLEVWDRQSLSPDGLATYTLDVEQALIYSYGITFISPTEFYGNNHDIVINLETRSLSRRTVPLPAVPVNITGISGYTDYSSDCDKRYIVQALPNRLDVLDNQTQATIHLADKTNRLHHARFSPDCRFLLVSTISDESHSSYDSVVYNVANGQRIAEFLNKQELQFRWSPDSRYFWWFGQRWMGQRGDDYLLNTDTGALVVINLGDPNVRFQYEPYWDLERGQMLIMLDWTIHAIDLQTGELRYRYLPPLETEYCRRRSPSGCQWYVEAEMLYLMGHTAVTIWNLNTSEMIASVDGAEAGTPVFWLWAVSPDGRYLVAGDNVLRVWDLSAANLSTPLYVWDFAGTINVSVVAPPKKGVYRLRFTESATVVQIQTSTGTLRVDILTGETLP